VIHSWLEDLTPVHGAPLPNGLDIVPSGAPGPVMDRIPGEAVPM
jgi:hypothetical protein